MRPLGKLGDRGFSFVTLKLHTKRFVWGKQPNSVGYGC